MLIRPAQELKAFAKVTPQPGQSRTVSLTLGQARLRRRRRLRHAWVAEAGRFEVRLDSSSAEWVDPISRESTRSTIRA